MLVPVTWTAKVGKSFEPKHSSTDNTGSPMFWFSPCSCHKNTLVSKQLRWEVGLLFQNPSYSSSLNVVRARIRDRNHRGTLLVGLLSGSFMLAQLAFLYCPGLATQGMTLFTMTWVLQHRQSRQPLTDMPREQPDKDNHSTDSLFPGPCQI